MELKPRGSQRWSAIIGEGTAHGATIAAHHLGLGICAPFQVPFDRPNTSHAFFHTTWKVIALHGMLEDDRGR